MFDVRSRVGKSSVCGLHSSSLSLGPLVMAMLGGEVSVESWSRDVGGRDVEATRVETREFTRGERGSINTTLSTEHLNETNNHFKKTLPLFRINFSVEITRGISPSLTISLHALFLKLSIARLAVLKPPRTLQFTSICERLYPRIPLRLPRLNASQNSNQPSHESLPLFPWTFFADSSVSLFTACAPSSSSSVAKGVGS